MTLGQSLSPIQNLHQTNKTKERVKLKKKKVLNKKKMILRSKNKKIFDKRWMTKKGKQ